MWLHDDRHCVTAQYLVVVDHHGCSLEGQSITTWADPSGTLVGTTPSLWWLCRLTVGHITGQQACLTTPERTSASC